MDTTNKSVDAGRKVRSRIIATILLLSCGISFSQTVPSYQWQVVGPSAPTAQRSPEVQYPQVPRFSQRDGAGALVYDNKMWLIGGWNPSLSPTTDFQVWSSTNGAQWSLVNAGVSKPEGRHSAGYVVFKNKMWVIGGDIQNGHYQSDVWRSSDGINWESVSLSELNPFQLNRTLHYTVVFDDKIWVMGGQTQPKGLCAKKPSNDPCSQDPGEPTFYNDVWSSDNGESWVQVTSGAPWTPRGVIGGSVVFKGQMWIIGGGKQETLNTDESQVTREVWSSVDGSTWTQHSTPSSMIKRRYHSIAVFDNRIWIIAGTPGSNASGSLGNLNEVWSSADGDIWTQHSNAPWVPRHAASVFVYGDALWLTGGSGGPQQPQDGSPQNDVWKLVRADTATTAISISNPSFEADLFTVFPAGWSSKTLEAPATGTYAAFGENRYLYPSSGEKFAAPNHAGYLYQNTGKTILPNRTYSLSVDFADIGFPDYRGDQAIRLFRGDPTNGGTMFAQANIAQTEIPRIQNPNADQNSGINYPVVGKWMTKTLSYTTGSSGSEIGGTLWIALANLPASPHRYEFVGEDNVRLSYACNIPIANPSFEQDQFVNPPVGWLKKTLEAPGTYTYSAFGENRYLVATNGTQFAAPNHAGFIYQNTGHTVLPNTTYAFTVDFADIGFPDYRGDQALRLYDHDPSLGGDHFAELQVEKTEIPRFTNPNTGSPVPGQWITRTLKFTTGGAGSPGVGQPLWVAIANLITASHRYEFVAEDNVRLTYSCGPQ